MHSSLCLSPNPGKGWILSRVRWTQAAMIMTLDKKTIMMMKKKCKLLPQKNNKRPKMKKKMTLKDAMKNLMI